MATVQNTLKSGLPAKINSNQLDAELIGSIGPDIGWAVEYDGEKKPVGIRYEYPEEAKYDPRAIEAVFQGHTIPPGEDDDETASEKAAQASLEQAEKLKIILGAFEDLAARVAALEGKQG